MDISQTSSCYILESTSHGAGIRHASNEWQYSELQKLSCKDFHWWKIFGENKTPKIKPASNIVRQNYSKLLPTLLTCLDSTICMELGWGCEEGLCLALLLRHLLARMTMRNTMVLGAVLGSPGPANNTLEREEGWNILEVWQFGPSYN